MPLGQVSISYYLPHLQYYNYRAEVLNVEPCQFIGEIYMQYQMLGYWHRPENFTNEVSCDRSHLVSDKSRT